MRVMIDLAKCCGNGMCVMEAPAVFDQHDEDGTVILLDESPGTDQEEAVRSAAKHCPTEAITLVDA
ncbi:Ferredoxin [Haloechinothrix alba]|uniref:Ferredoxin n=1 Tax=Haloechinothrix alba TaxID=664784 RepID=A0A239A5V1_9PSEU|nr:ferredoxin [Haloechinothrix alba]SNR91015.1 Ferredoxin [Haloechinothrix alba]